MLLAAFLALGLVASPSAWATHFTSYASLPTEHDDMGSSAEPDFASTSVLGGNLNQRVIDWNLDGVAEPDTDFSSPTNRPLAPGCSNDAGRQPNGLCGLWTIGAGGTQGTDTAAFPPGTLGIQGRSDSLAPGLTQTKAKEVRLLDHQVALQAPGSPTLMADYNRKLSDQGVGAALRGLDSRLGSQALLPFAGEWAWYGRWADRNGNGVIDHLQSSTTPSGPVADPENEFQWYGNCLAYDGSRNPGWHCFDESASRGSRVVMVGYVVPGHHRGNDPVGAGVALVDQALDVGASPTPDALYLDRSGDPAWDTRAWNFGQAWPNLYYDQSLLTTTTSVTGVNCPQEPTRRQYALERCTFLDIDKYTSWNPTLGDLLQGLRASGNDVWTQVRDARDPAARGVDRMVHPLVQTSPVLGPIDDALLDPGWSREPNTASDRYPGAIWRAACPDAEARHRGWCNDYSGYRAGPLGWADVQDRRTVVSSRVTGIDGVGCLVCAAGPLVGPTTATPEPIAGSPRSAGDHRRTLGPGEHIFVGGMGRWHDRPHAWQTSYLDLAAVSPTLGQVITLEERHGPDGWVGNIVNTTGTYAYRGYGVATCTTEQGPGLHSHAECNPYFDGVVQDPQAPAGIEWTSKLCDETRATLEIRPDSAWSGPVFVVRGYESMDLPSGVAKVDDWTGRSGSFHLTLMCRGDQGGFATADSLVLPFGTPVGVTTVLTAEVLTPSGGKETIIDVDRYEPIL